MWCAAIRVVAVPRLRTFCRSEAFMPRCCKTGYRQPTSPRSSGHSHGVSWFVSAKRSRQITLDLALSVTAVLLAELHPDPSRAFTLSTLGCHPDDTSCNGQLFILAHQVEQHENFIAEPIVAVGRNEQ